MSMSSDTPRDNLTLSESELAVCRPIVGEGGYVLRALCPFHGSDCRRSPQPCGAWRRTIFWPVLDRRRTLG